MSIKNLSERRRLPRIGKIRLGVKLRNTQGVEYPHAENHFVCPAGTDPGAGLVQAVYGDAPTELDIVFPSDKMDMVARQEYKYYIRTRKNPICRGNGEVAFQLTDMETGAIASKDSKQIEMRKITVRRPGVPVLRPVPGGAEPPVSAPNRPGRRGVAVGFRQHQLHHQRKLRPRSDPDAVRHNCRDPAQAEAGSAGGRGRGETRKHLCAPHHL